MNKLIYILLIFLAIETGARAQKPKTDAYGAYSWSYGVVDTTQTNTMLGMKYPRSAYAERLLKKREKLKLTPRENRVLIKFYNGKDLTPAENIILKKALRKQEKRDKLVYKYTLDTLRRNAKINPELSPYEKRLLDKEKDSSQTLSPSEQKALRLIHRHQANLEKIKRRQTLTPQDSALLLKANNDSARLSLGEKIKLISLKQKQKRIHNIRVAKMAQQGFPTPVKVTGFQKVIQSVKFFNPRNRPSSYIRKAHHLDKKYSLSPAEQEAYNKMRSGVPLLTLKEKYLAQKAYYKVTKYQEQKHKLNQKYFWSMQDKEVKKRHKKHLKQNTHRYQRRKVFRLFNNLKQTLKRLLS